MRAVVTAAVLLATATTAFALKVTITATTDGQNKPTVLGTTNLPDGVELMVTISRKASSYMAQDKARVTQGAFRAGPFSDGGKALNPGIYTIEVSMPVAAVQPPATWPTIGNNGSKLEGPLTKRSSFGGRIAEYRTSFRIGDGKASPSKDEAARAQSAEDIHAWWLKSCNDTCAVTRGVARKRNEPFDWDRCYYRCVADEPKKR